MYIKYVLASYLSPHLPNSFEEWKAFDVADRASHLYDDNAGAALLRYGAEAFLYFICNVRYYLYRAAEKIAPALLRDYRIVNLSRRDAGGPGELYIDETLLVPQVEVCFRSILSDEDLAVLIRRHGARVYV